eukprot:7189910-Prymnesium_polylepis.1
MRLRGADSTVAAASDVVQLLDFGFRDDSIQHEARTEALLRAVALLGGDLVTTTGWGADDVRRIVTRALQLGRQAGRFGDAAVLIVNRLQVCRGLSLLGGRI